MVALKVYPSIFSLRFGDHVERVMPLVLRFAEQEDDELKENVLQVGDLIFIK